MHRPGFVEHLPDRHALNFLKQLGLPNPEKDGKVTQVCCLFLMLCFRIPALCPFEVAAQESIMGAPEREQRTSKLSQWYASHTAYCVNQNLCISPPHTHMLRNSVETKAHSLMKF